MDELEKFIIRAKANAWVGLESGGKKVPASKRNSLDTVFDQGEFHYHDSFVGLSDFAGQEHICHKNQAVWSMSYYGYLLQPELVTGSEIGQVLKAALGAMYREGRFLGGFRYLAGEFEYVDTNVGPYQRFSGKEEIRRKGALVYELLYFGGQVRE